MKDTVLRRAMGGDSEAARVALREALRRDDWRLATELCGAVAAGQEGSSCYDDLEDWQLIARGVKEFDAGLHLTRREDVVLPEGLVVRGDAHLQQSGVMEIPDNVRIRGDVTATGSKLRRVGSGVYIEGHARFDRTPLEEIGEDFVCGSLHVDEVPIDTLPGSLTVRDVLWAVGRTGLTFEEGILLQGNVYLNRSRRLYLPPGQRIGGDLNLRGSDDVILPEGLHVAGDLDLRWSTRVLFPDGMTVEGDVYLTEGGEWPSRIVVGGSVFRLPE